MKEIANIVFFLLLPMFMWETIILEAIGLAETIDIRSYDIFIDELESDQLNMFFWSELKASLLK